MSKQLMDLRVIANQSLGELYNLLVLSPVNFQLLPHIEPGQFVQVAVPDSKTTFLRRPISVNRVTKDRRELHLLIRKAGDGTRKLADSQVGDILNILLPLGNGFPMTDMKDKRVLLIGGGVGVAPLLY
ncbi:MAG: dihydroorotate dehydrogenase electron transfer subunit, partial [Muribaculaceae bacterium]|nr:dihydroorotate dehydrogenase electron transfer subunit [Muribaculaceae bacterium]